MKRVIDLSSAALRYGDATARSRAAGPGRDRVGRNALWVL